MRRKPKTELDPSEPYRHYRVLDGSVDDATVPDATDATDDGDKGDIFVAIIMIVLSIATFGVYVAIFVAVVAAVVWWLASMFGLIDLEFW